MAHAVTIVLSQAFLALPRLSPAQGSPRPTPSPSRLVTLQRLLRAEDMRGLGPDRLGPLVEGLASADAELRRVAVRGLGRLEQPQTLSAIAPLLTDSIPAVRAEGVNAVAQSLRAALTVNASATPAVKALVDSVFGKLVAGALAEREAFVIGVYARSLGRLPYGMAAQARDAEEAINAIVGRATTTDSSGNRSVPASLLEGAVHGLYDLARARRTLGDLTGPAIAVLRSAASRTADSAGGADAIESAARIRRLAWLALTATGHRNELLVRNAIHDSDPQVRRLAVLYLPNVADVFLQREVLRTARTDSAFMVRLEWVRIYRQLLAQDDCDPLLMAVDDPNPHVRLAAIDALGARCPRGTPVMARLRPLIDSIPPLVAVRTAGQASWHPYAHALVSVARIDSAAAAQALRRAVTHAVWQVRLYAARAAAVLKDTSTLVRLAGDAIGSVREAALDGLVTVAGHAADRTYVNALASADYPAVLAAAKALKDAERSPAIVSAAFAALERLSAARRETSRDPRLELLARIEEMGDSSGVRRLLPFLRDFDPAVAERAAGVLRHWTGRTVPASPSRIVSADSGLARLYTAGVARVRITMAPTSGGGSFVLRLDPTTAPATVSRVLALVAKHYYDGLTWHRVVANFVVQGGSPGMNEYVGDASFLRDELSLASHVRGTVGISTRGRDTGDAQLFVNLVDNFRLDHDYTVLARVESGMDVVDGLLEGDTIAQVVRIP